jgi:hypothetical protein
MNSERSLKKTRGKARGRKSVSPGVLSPPKFVPTISLGHKFRFTTGTNSVVFQGITRAMLLNLYTMATGTTVQNRILTAVKIKRVSVWGGVPALGGAPTSIEVEWLGSNAPSTIHTDSSMGVRPSFVTTVPPRDSSDRWWSISGQNETEVLLVLTIPAGSIIDLDLSIRLADNEAAVLAESGTAAAATAGEVYWNYLDGFASKKLMPAGGVTVLP